MTESDYSHPTPEEEMSGDLPLDPRSDTPDPLERPGTEGAERGVVDVEDEIEEGNPNPPGADV